MGHFPRLHFDRRKRQFYCRHHGYHYLGTDAAAARRRYAEIVADIPLPDRPTSVSGLIERWLTEEVGEYTDWLKTMVDAWDSFAGHKPLTAITTDHVVRYANSLRRSGQAAQTIRHKCSATARALRWAHKQGWLAAAPEQVNWARFGKPPRAPKDIPLADLARVFANLPAGTDRVLRFIIATGCRPGEACRLQWSEVDLAAKVCTLASHKTGRRTGRPRTIYLTPAAVAVLEQTPRTGATVFRNRRGGPFTTGGLRSVLRRRGFTGTYQLRHTFAQHALDQGVGVAELSALLGHTDLRMVSVYAQVRDKRARAVAETLAAPAPLQLHADQPADRRTGSAALAAASSPDKRRPKTRKRAAARRA